MINLRVQPSGEGHKLVLTPRAACQGVKGQELDLVYAHRCPTCGNVIQALFRTPKEVSLWPFEETVVLSQGEKNMGEVRKIFPEPKTKWGSSCYRSQFSAVEGGVQKIVLKNHILRHRAIAERAGKPTGEGLWEVGERTCSRTGIFAVKEDLLVKDVLLFSGMSEYELANFNLPPLVEIIPANGFQSDSIRLAIPVGNALPVVLVNREKVVYGFQDEIRPRLTPFKKS
jgi:hypothetical protein